jgi:Protein of unknown function (DUF2939)
MRWIVRLLVVLAVAWAGYVVSPYYALYDLARAVDQRNIEAIKERVNFSAVRISLSRQLVTAYLIATGRESELKSQNRGLVVAAGGTLAAPLLAEYVSAEAFADFLAGRKSIGPVSGGAGGGGGVAAALRDSALGIDSLAAAWKLFMAAETRGFRVMSFPVPPDKAPDDQFRLVFRLAGFTWRLVGFEVPKPIQDRLVQEMLKREGKAAPG